MGSAKTSGNEPQESVSRRERVATLPAPVVDSAPGAAGVLAATAYVLATAGGRRITRALPPVPEEALEGLEADISEIKERTTR